jgi:hypothetical protein
VFKNTVKLNNKAQTNNNIKIGLQAGLLLDKCKPAVDRPSQNSTAMPVRLRQKKFSTTRKKSFIQSSWFLLVGMKGKNWSVGRVV